MTLSHATLVPQHPRPSEARALTIQGLPFVDASRATVAIDALGPRLERAEVNTLVAQALQRKTAYERFALLAATLNAARPENRPPVVQALVPLLANGDLIAELATVLPNMAAALEPHTLVRCLDSATTAMTTGERLRLYRDVAREVVDPGLQSSIVEMGLLSVEEPADISDGVEALSVLLDVLEPFGTANSFEPWRPKPSQCLVRTPLRTLLRIATPRRQRLIDAAERLIAAVDSGINETARSTIDARLHRIRAESEPRSALDETSIRVLKEWNSSPEADRDLGDLLRAHAPTASVAEVLRLLASLVPWLPADAIGTTLSEHIDKTRLDWETVWEVFRLLSASAFVPLASYISDARETLGSRALAVESRYARRPDKPSTVDER